MKIASNYQKKRGVITTIVLLAGVTFAGVVAAIIETPQGQNSFLHEHLALVPLQENLNWEALDFDLPEQDKAKIAQIISQIEHPLFTKGLREVLAGPTLDKAQSCLLYTSPSPRDATLSRMPSSA